MLPIKLTAISFSYLFINCVAQRQPRILSSLYGYDNCIGGVNNFDTEEEYLNELKSRNCTVENGHTNVVDASRLVTINYCRINPFIDNQTHIFMTDLDWSWVAAHSLASFNGWMECQLCSTILYLRDQTQKLSYSSYLMVLR